MQVRLTYRIEPLPFSVLLGKTITKIEGLEKGGERVILTTSDGREYLWYHEQECCENVTIEDVCGDPADLLDRPLVMAEEVAGETGETDYGSFTWTFYKLATTRGSVTVRWYGASNGCYSETVNFGEIVNLPNGGANAPRP